MNWMSTFFGILLVGICFLPRTGNCQTQDDADRLLLDFVSMAEDVNQCCSYSYILETELYPANDQEPPHLTTEVVRYARNGNEAGRRDYGSRRLNEDGSVEWLIQQSEVMLDGKFYRLGLSNTTPLNKTTFFLPHFHPFGVPTASRYGQTVGKTSVEGMAAWASRIQFLDIKQTRQGFVACWFEPSRTCFYRILFHEDAGFMPTMVEFRAPISMDKVDEKITTLDDWTKATRPMIQVLIDWKSIGKYWVPVFIDFQEEMPTTPKTEQFKQRYYIANWTIDDPSFGEKDFSRTRAMLEYPLAIKASDFDLDHVKSIYVTYAFFEQLESQIRSAVGRKETKR